MVGGLSAEFYVQYIYIYQTGNFPWKNFQLFNLPRNTMSIKLNQNIQLILYLLTAWNCNIILSSTLALLFLHWAFPEKNQTGGVEDMYFSWHPLEIPFKIIYPSEFPQNFIWPSGKSTNILYTLWKIHKYSLHPLENPS